MQVQKLHVDVAVQGVTVDFCGNSQVMAYLVSACRICLTHSLPGYKMPHFTKRCQALLVHSIAAHHALYSFATHTKTQQSASWDCQPDQTKTPLDSSAAADIMIAIATCHPCSRACYGRVNTITTVAMLLCVAHAISAVHPNAVHCPCSRSLQPHRPSSTALLPSRVR